MSRPDVVASAENGVALIMVLLAMALIIMLAAGMSQQQSIRVYKASHYLSQQQGFSIALGAEAFASRILVRDLEEDKEENLLVDSPDELWAKHAAILPLDDQGVAEIQIDDLGGRINLNNLVAANGQIDPVTRDRLNRLFRALGIMEVSVDALIDWIDSNDQTISAHGAEDGRYLLKEPGYRAANQPFASITELRLIDGMTEEIYLELSRHVSALPVSSVGINVNSATAPVLMSLHDEMTEAQAESIIARREEERFEDLRDFSALPELAGPGFTKAGLSLQTRFFDVVARIAFDNRVVTMVSTVFRNAEGQVRTVHRDTSQKHRITKEPYSVSEG